jgi:hypothetical protein
LTKNENAIFSSSQKERILDFNDRTKKYLSNFVNINHVQKVRRYIELRFTELLDELPITLNKTKINEKPVKPIEPTDLTYKIDPKKSYFDNFLDR